MIATDALTTTSVSEDARGAVATMKTKTVTTIRKKMKAIIEIPDDLIRSAGSAIALSRPHLMDEAIEAMHRLAKVDELTLNFNGMDQKDTIEESIAMMCVTQTMSEIVKGHE